MGTRAVTDPGEELYRVPPSEFAKARDALAADLVRAGRRAEAIRIRARKRPTAAVWAVNAVAREHPHAVARYFEAGRRLRDAHRRAVEAGDGDRLRAAMREELDLGQDLLALAGEMLLENGLAATSPALEQIHATFSAAARAGGEAEALVRAGRLEHAIEPMAAFHGRPPRTLRGNRASAKKRQRDEEHAARQAALRRHRETVRAAAASRAKVKRARQERLRSERLLALAEEARARAAALEAEART